MEECFGRQTGSVNIQGEARVHLGNNYVTHQHYPQQQAKTNIYKTLVDSLRFDGMGARVRNVAAALPTTCKWLPRLQNFVAWTEGRRLHEHNGFLWIKGKPGSGKSTVMKETLAWFEKERSDQIVLCYFFNARSPHPLDKSSLGLYRSLLWQLQTALPNSRALFVKQFKLKVREGKANDVTELEVEEWTEIELQNFWIRVFQELQQLPPITIFIDALDEGIEEDIRRMVKFLERVTQCATAAVCPLRICLSSRHYPNISVAKSISIVLEDQPEHLGDIKLYIQSELVGGNILGIDQLRQAILDRSTGVFLWVVLVIPTLNRAYDQGRNAATMLQKLDEIPRDLSDVFTQILLRDIDDLDECITLLRWVLFAKRPLSPIELYCAIRRVYIPIESNDSTVTVGESIRYLRNCSRGLVELTRTREPSVQFIHETIRDYLTGWNKPKQRESELLYLGISAQGFSAGVCHEKLAEDCLRCFLSCCHSPNRSGTRCGGIGVYAAEYWWQHLQVAQSMCSETVLELALKLLTGSRDSLRFWYDQYNIEAPYFSRRGPAPPLYYAAFIGRQELVSGVLNLGADVNATGGLHRTALRAASARGYQQVVQILVDAGADVDAREPHGTALHIASEAGHERVVQTLVNAGANVNLRKRVHRANSRIEHDGLEKVGDSALNVASKAGYERVVQILLDAGADIDTRGATGHTALYTASSGGRRKVVQVLVEAGADVNAREGGFGTALHTASANGHEKVVEVLLEAGADINARVGSCLTVLRAASINGRANVVEILVKAGADINDSKELTSTALEDALNAGHYNVAHILRARGARSKD